MNKRIWIRICCEVCGYWIACALAVNVDIHHIVPSHDRSCHMTCLCITRILFYSWPSPYVSAKLAFWFHFFQSLRVHLFLLFGAMSGDVCMSHIKMSLLAIKKSWMLNLGRDLSHRQNAYEFRTLAWCERVMRTPEIIACPWSVYRV